MAFTNHPALKSFGIFLMMLLTSQIALSQKLKLVNDQSLLTIAGTSSLHDWTIEAEEQAGTLVFKNRENGEIESCYVEVAVEGLESGRKSMNRNTYKALNSDAYKSIQFELTEVTETVAQGDNTFTVTAKGDLTIAGVKKPISLEFSLKITGDNVAIKGKKKIKMTTFNVDPPTALLGTITTGDEVTIVFESEFKNI